MKGNVTSICGSQEMRTRDLFPKTSFLWICGFPCSSVGKRICLQCRRPWVWSLGWEDPLEKETATHSSILAWRILWTEKPGGLQSVGLRRVRHDLGTKLPPPSWVWELLPIHLLPTISPGIVDP
ncbi:unnamed protein product [Rangifer tarandus platyrhynchus]|uniref:Uncharacterized protein n=1 Tax=Rangifer tarandus platyrhynchus TaxID=3082113 RepID=A0AC59Y3X1_RANTA